MCLAVENSFHSLRCQTLNIITIIRIACIWTLIAVKIFAATSTLILSFYLCLGISSSHRGFPLNSTDNETISFNLTNKRMNGAQLRHIRPNVVDENIPSSRYSNGRSSPDVTWTSVRDVAIAMRPVMANPSISHSWYHFPGNSNHVLPSETAQCLLLFSHLQLPIDFSPKLCIYLLFLSSLIHVFVTC